uniref:type II secretion system protein GspL n=1 Tax=Ningiella ruwaisensis TaxID=2364274 RepID=UPI00109EE549|nr:type II secretion system protein GspL [Ningiella ruwaisensis]
MQRLILRLGSELEQAVPWLVYNDDEQEIIASGELPSAAELSSLKERADSSEVIGLLCASNTFISSVELPPNASRKVLSAIPFMLEEDICGDINAQFVALGKKIDNKQSVAVIAHEKIEHWQRVFNDAGIFCQKLYPDVLCLPVHENAYSLVQLNDTLLARFDAFFGADGEPAWLLDLIKQKAKLEEKALNCYSDIDGLEQTDGSDIECQYNYDDLPLLLMLKSINDTSINLFQGKYAVKRQGNATWNKWKIAAILAGVALSVNLVSKTLELNELKAQRSAINQEIRETITQAFPDIGQYRNARLAIERKMTALEQAGGDLSMLAIMSQLSDAFASSGVSPQTLRYDASRTELRMQSVANNFESLERFRRDIQALGFEVEQGAINNQGEQVVGVIVVKG